MAEDSVVFDDDNTKIGELTVAQYVQLTGLVEKRKKLDALIKEYTELNAAAASARDQSAQIFEEAAQLSAVTSPFRLKSVDDVEKLAVTLRSLVTDKAEALCAIGVIERGAVRAVNASSV